MKMKPSYAIIMGLLFLLISIAAFTPLNWLVQTNPPVGQNTMTMPDVLEMRADLVTAEMKAAPLFEKGRKPFVIKVAEPLKPVERDPFEGWRLSGVMQVSSGAMVAWLQKGSERPKKITVGDEMFGWQVSLIEAGRIELIKDEKHKILEQGK